MNKFWALIIDMNRSMKRMWIDRKQAHDLLVQRGNIVYNLSKNQIAYLDYEVNEVLWKDLDESEFSEEKVV